MAELDLKNYKNRHSLKSKIARVLWNLVWILLFRPTPRGNLFRPWRIALLKMFGAKVKWSSSVLPSCRIWQPWKLTMGAYACLSEDVDCYTVDEIVIGDQATISQGVKLCCASHDIASKIMELTYRPIVIKSSGNSGMGRGGSGTAGQEPRPAEARPVENISQIRLDSTVMVSFYLGTTSKAVSQSAITF